MIKGNGIYYPIKQLYKRGDRVVSKVSGFYLGQPSTVIGLSQLQFGAQPKYDISLDGPDKIISLPQHHIMPLSEFKK